jgi:glycosyltransferase involved in cell wall biosynthesis
VAVVGPTYPFRGGISHYTTLLVRALRARHEVFFVTYQRQYPALLFPGRSDSDPSGENALWVEAEPLIDSLNPLTWYRAARAIARQQPQLLVLQWTVSFWGPLLLTLLALVRRGSPRTRVVLLCHNATPHEGRGRAGAWMQTALARRCDALICHSTTDQAVLRQMASGKPIRVVMHPSYEALAQRGNPIPQEAARASLDVRGDPVILFFGFVRHYKGVDLLFRAMPRILEEFPKAFLIVAGEWWKDALPAREEVTRLALGERVRLLDDYLPNERLPLLFAAADVMALPYRSATQSGVVQLAYGFDLPVITTAVGGLPEAVQHEVSGLVVPPDNPEALAEAVIRYHREGWHERLRPGVAHARERFSWEAMVEAIEQAGLEDG